jgi:putative acetyltransferase
MINLLKTDHLNPDFIELVALLDEGLKVTDGDLNAFYDQFNKIDTIKTAIVAYENGIAVACGAFKPYDEQTVEIKRMYVKSEFRGNGYSKLVLKELETWAKSLGYSRAILETGKLQIEALKLYPSAGYDIFQNYGQYIGVENSVCFQKEFIKSKINK